MKTLLSILIGTISFFTIYAQTGTVEEMPRFPGCEDDNLSREEKIDCATQKLLQFVYGNLKYPVEAKRWKTEGTVVIQFVVDVDGSIIEPNIIKDIGDGCGEEVLRVVQEMPVWIPGIQKGRPVKVKYTLPVKFALNQQKQN